MKFQIFKPYIRWDRVEDFEINYPGMSISFTSDDFEMKWNHILIFHIHELIDWDCLSKDPNISEECFEFCYPYLKWKYVCMFNKNITIDFIRNHLSAINRYWNELSVCQKLTEEIITEFADLVNWKFVSRYQNLSPEFILKKSIKNRIDWVQLAKNPYVSEEFVLENKPKPDN